MRDALGDLAVSIVELAKKPTPPYVQSRMATFANWFRYGEPFFHQVIDAGLTVVNPTKEELAPLTAAFAEAGHVVELMEHSSVAFDYIGYEYGYLYGGAQWFPLCQWRSAAQFLADFGLTLDLSGTDEGLAHWGHELFEKLEVPEGMPTAHWWWFRDRPE